MTTYYVPGMDKAVQTVILWRPVGPKQLDLIEQTGMRASPSHLPEQPVFYPVTTEAYAIKIARNWTVPAKGRGYVTRFRVRSDFVQQYAVQEGGAVRIVSIGRSVVRVQHGDCRTNRGCARIGAGSPGIRGVTAVRADGLPEIGSAAVKPASHG